MFNKKVNASLIGNSLKISDVDKYSNIVYKLMGKLKLLRRRKKQRFARVNKNMKRLESHEHVKKKTGRKQSWI